MTGVENTPELRQQLVDLCASEIGLLQSQMQFLGCWIAKKHAPERLCEEF